MLQDYGIITSLTPVSGWHYLQTWDGGVQRIPPEGEAPDEMSLVRQVTLFRVNQQMEVGDVESDVADYIKFISPANIRLNGAKPSSVTHGFRPLITRIQAWLAELIPQRPRRVRDEVAQARGLICLACPQHIKWQTECDPCNGAIEYHGRVLRQKAAFPLDKQLTGGCRLHNFLCSAAIFLNLESLPARSPEAPPQCWLE
jgi:hypothetical protein